MLGYLLFFICLGLGLAIVRRLPLTLYRLEAWAIAIAIGLLTGTWILFVMALMLPYLLAVPVAGIVMLLIIAGLWRRGAPSKWQSLPITAWVWLPFSFIVLICSVYLLDIHFLKEYSDGLHSMGPVWGDLALHLNLISYFAAQDHFTTNMPVYIEAKLTYPFLIDFLSGMLFRSGMSLRMALILPALALIVSFSQLLFFLSYRLFKSARAGIITQVLLLIGASFGGLALAFKDWQASGQGLMDFLKTTPHDYSYYPEQGLHVYNIVLGFLLPQRGILLGLPIFCLLVIIWFEVHRSKEKPNGLLWFSGLLLGLLPFAHVHTFLVGVFVLAWLTALKMAQEKKFINPWLQTLLIAVVVALPQLIWQFTTNYHTGFGVWHLGWELKTSENLLGFWWQNSGIVFPLLFILPFLIWKYLSGRFYLALYLPFLFIFLAVNVYIFQPNPYDNSKFLVYVWLGTYLFIGYFLAVLSRAFKGASVVVVGLILLMLGSGILSFFYDMRQSYVFVSASDVAFAADFQKLVPKEAVVLTSDKHNHPIAILGGRQIVMGYRGWLWTYGYNYSLVEAAVGNIYQGDGNVPELLQRYGVTYVVIGESEIRQWGADLDYFKEHYKEIYQSADWTVFKVL